MKGIANRYTTALLSVIAVLALAAFSAPAMGSDCDPDAVTTAPWGTNGTVTNGTMVADGGEPCTSSFNNLDVGTIPAGATIKWARLYWHAWMPGSWTNVTFCNATGCNQTDFDISDPDPNGCYQGQDWGFYRGGETHFMYWNVTNLVKSGAHNVSIDNRPAPDGRCMQCYLVVVYEKDGYPTTSYWVNQGHMYLGPGGAAHTTNFNAPPSADNTTNGTLWQLGLTHNKKVEIWFNTVNLVTTTYGGGGCGYGVLERYDEIPAGWINAAGGNSMTWKSWDDYYHPVLAMFMDQPVVTNTTKSGGGGVKVRETWKIHQDKYSGNATDLHFKLWQKGDNIEVNGWDVTVSHFPNVIGTRGSQPPPHNGQVQNMPGLPATNNPDNGNHAVDITANGANVPFCTWVTVDATFWLTDWNTKRISNITWTNVSNVSMPEIKAVPNHGWCIGWPTPDPLNSGRYLHKFNITNDDAVDTFNVSGLAFNATMDWYDDLEGISFPTPYANFTLAPGQNWSTTINTTGDMVGGHIYFTYSLNGSGSSDVVSTDWVDHPVVSNEKIIVLKDSDFDVLVNDSRATKDGDTYYIQNLTITNNMGDGITIKNTNATFVINNCTIENCTGSGVFLHDLKNGTINGSNILNNTKYGIKVGEVSLGSDDPEFVNITNNTINGSKIDGIDLIGFNCTVKNNTISNSTVYGIYLFANDTDITDNTIRDNGNYGIKAYNSYRNDIDHNKFIDNNDTNLGHQAWDNKGQLVNNWDDESTGNCWSDWSDNTGYDPDEVYSIDGEASQQDDYPSDECE